MGEVLGHGEGRLFGEARGYKFKKKIFAKIDWKGADFWGPNLSKNLLF